MAVFKRQLTDTLKVWICKYQYYGGIHSGCMSPRPTHRLSNQPWVFTGRYRYRPNLEVEVRFQSWHSVPRPVYSWWDGFWNGKHTLVLREDSQWVGYGHFHFEELQPIYTYSCEDEERKPEVTYG